MNNKKNLIILAFLTTYTMYSNGNTMISDNKTAYELAALAAHNYLHSYAYVPGSATTNTCSVHGKALCSVLSQLRERTRLFKNPERDDLKELSNAAALSFRNFDLLGNSNDEKIFVKRLINLLQATLPLLESSEHAECSSLIQELLKKL